MFFFAAIHVAEYANELLFFWGRVSLKQKHTKLKHRRIAHAFCLVLRLELGQFFPQPEPTAKSYSKASKNIVPASDFQGRGAPKQADINH